MLVCIDIHAMRVMLQRPLDLLAGDVLMVFRGTRLLLSPFSLYPNLSRWDRSVWLGVAIRTRCTRQHSRRADTRYLR